MVSMRRTTFCCLTVTLLLPAGASSEIYLARSVIGCGGGEGNSSSYNIAYTAGQIAVGRASGPTYLHEIGFWARTAMNPADVESDDSERLPERIDFRLTRKRSVSRFTTFRAAPCRFCTRDRSIPDTTTSRSIQVNSRAASTTAG
jgi:hypothetical protein